MLRPAHRRLRRSVQPLPRVSHRFTFIAPRTWDIIVARSVALRTPGFPRDRRSISENPMPFERPSQRQHLAAILLPLWLLACDGSEPTDSCVYNSDCQAHQICADGRCLAECQTTVDCDDGETCQMGVCQEHPTRDGGDSPDASTDAPPADVETDAIAEPDNGFVPDMSSLPDVYDLGARPGGFGELAGLVHFRLYDDALLPIAQPIVYWTYPSDPPADLNPNPSCDCGFPSTAVRGEADGTFVLSEVPAGWVYLVVQKGQFRRIRLVEVTADERLEVPLELTELPVSHDPVNGDTVPRIVIGTGRFDAIEDVFAKLRMGPISPTFSFDYDAYVADPGQWPVELMLYQTPRALDDENRELTAPSFVELLGDLDRMQTYHFIVVPCAEYNTYGTVMTSAGVRDNVRTFVNEGGKLYVTDYAYDVLEQVFPEYIDFSAPETGEGNADGHIGDPAYTGVAAQGTLRYESDNRAMDLNLADWLTDMGASTDGTLLTLDNWVNLNGVGTVSECCDSDGDWVEVTPQAVMTGPNFVERIIGDSGPSHDNWEAAELVNANYPHTVRFPYGCGEVMYSTYHTVESADRTANLRPQELVLLYLILEINQCNPNPVKW